MKAGSPKMTAGALLQRAVALHQGGQLDAALRCYDEILKADPRVGDALNLKGLILHDKGKLDEALSLFDRAAKVLPKFADVRFNKANTLAAHGRDADAIKAYSEAIALKPAYADARLNLGVLLQRMGKLEDAIETFRAFTTTHPTDHRAYYNLAVCLGQYSPKVSPDAVPQHVTETRESFERALSLNPVYRDAFIQFGNFLLGAGDLKGAIAQFEKALSLTHGQKDRAELLNNLGDTLRQDQRAAEAVAILRQALALDPASHVIRYNLAAALSDAGEKSEAEENYLDLIKTRGDFVRPYVNLGFLYKEQGKTDAAIRLFEEALYVDPGLRQAYANLGATFLDKGWMVTGVAQHDKAASLKESRSSSNDTDIELMSCFVLLNLGRLAEGWQKYHLRFQSKELKNPSRPSPPPYWNGEDLTGKKVVLWTEQGLGDEILYSSIFPEVLSCAEHCVIECSARMAPIFQRSFPNAGVVAYVGPSVAASPAHEFDYQIPAGNLGRFFRSDFKSFPNHSGYLNPDSQKRTRLRTKYEAIANERRIVGLSWRSTNPRLTNKSVALAGLDPVLRTPGIFFVNLQYGDCSEELAGIREKLGVEIFHDDSVDPMVDMDTFFAQVAAMDLVITVSNTTAHVAGSQNIPVWILLPFNRSLIWYWFRQREDSPWYPSARLIRKMTRDDDLAWIGDVSQQVGTELARWVSTSPRAS